MIRMSDARRAIRSESSIHHSSFIIHHSSIHRPVHFPRVAGTQPETPTPEQPTGRSGPRARTPRPCRRMPKRPSGFSVSCRRSGRRVLALTSPGDGDGKTSLLTGLAPELAASQATSWRSTPTWQTGPDRAARRARRRNCGPAGPYLPDQRIAIERLAAASGPWARLDRDVAEGWPLVLVDAASLGEGTCGGGVPSKPLRRCVSGGARRVHAAACRASGRRT